MRRFIVLPLLVLLAACTDRGPIGPDDHEGAELLAKKGDNSGKGGGGKPQPPADPEIAYVDRGGGSSRLFVMNADGTRQTEVFRASYLTNPSWSPRGGTLEDTYSIVFRKDSKTWRDPDNHISLWVTDVVISDGEPVALSTGPIIEEDKCGNRRGTGTCWPAWSPDGDWIAVAEGFTSGTSHLWRIEAAGCLVWEDPCVTELYSSFGHVLSPAWSPESDRIAVFVNPPGSGDAFIAIVHLPLSTPVDTIALMDLDPQLDWVFDIDWARTGDFLALDALAVGGSGRRVWTLELTTDCLAGNTCVVTEVVEGLEPSWSPDNSKLAFAKSGIRVVDVATGDVERLAKGREPDWRR